MNFTTKQGQAHRPVLARLGLCLVLTMLAYGVLFSASTLAQTAYNFNWSFAGDEGVAPVQIFDDGQRVYLQFAQGVEMPAVFADTPAGPLLLTPEKQSPYTVVSSLETKLSFRLQHRTARAWRAATAAGNPAPEAVTTGLAAPTSISGLAAPLVMNGSAQTPVSLEQMASRRTPGQTEAQGAATPALTPPTISGEPVQRYRIALDATTPAFAAQLAPMSATLSPAPVVMTAPTVAPAPSAPATVTTVDVTQSAHLSPEKVSIKAKPQADPKSDAKAGEHAQLTSDTISEATTAILPAAPVIWSARAGMRLSELITEWGSQQGWTVRWDTSLDYPIEAAFDIQAETFLDAANDVFSAYQDAQEPFSVTAYANHVLIVKGLKK